MTNAMQYEMYANHCTERKDTTDKTVATKERDLFPLSLHCTLLDHFYRQKKG